MDRIAVGEEGEDVGVILVVGHESDDFVGGSPPPPPGAKPRLSRDGRHWDEAPPGVGRSQRVGRGGIIGEFDPKARA